MTEIDGKDYSFTSATSPFVHSATPGRERKKFVSFTVELQREEGQLGMIIRIPHTYFGASYTFNCCLSYNNLKKLKNYLSVILCLQV